VVGAGSEVRRDPEKNLSCFPAVLDGLQLLPIFLRAALLRHIAYLLKKQIRRMRSFKVA
jgi:hypothetical protein